MNGATNDVYQAKPGVPKSGHRARTDLEVGFEVIVAPEVVLLELGPKDGRRRACRPLHHPVPLHNLLANEVHVCVRASGGIEACMCGGVGWYVMSSEVLYPSRDTWTPPLWAYLAGAYLGDELEPFVSEGITVAEEHPFGQLAERCALVQPAKTPAKQQKEKETHDVCTEQAKGARRV